MAVRAGTQVTTKSRILRRVRRHLDGLGTREAHLLRGLYGLAEGPDAQVGEPVESCSQDTKRRVLAIEAEILSRARDHAQPREGAGVKQKIVRSLRRKRH
jgi:hypothetical protein